MHIHRETVGVSAGHFELYRPRVGAQKKCQSRDKQDFQINEEMTMSTDQRSDIKM